MQDDKTTKAALRDLERVRSEGETLGGTAMEQATRGLSGAHEDDDIERLGRRIGRGLAFVALPFALYFFGRTAGWW